MISRNSYVISDLSRISFLFDTYSHIDYSVGHSFVILEINCFFAKLPHNWRRRSVSLLPLTVIMASQRIETFDVQQETFSRFIQRIKIHFAAHAIQA